MITGLRTASAAIDATLAQIEIELDEARNDVAVAIALKAEEQLRIDGVNAHRTQILNEHVDFVVYHRPRAVSIRQDAPVVTLEPALTTAPVPDCINENLPLPPDLASLREVFRDAPVKWFTNAVDWIGRIDRWEHLYQLLRRIGARGDLAPRPTPIVSPGRYTLALNKIFIARASVAQNQFILLRQLDLGRLPGLGWIDLRREALDKLTLGLLIENATSEAANAAAEELANLFKVAACLHRDFGKVPALIRLAWAEQFSQFDGPADFRDLGLLPRWGEIEFTLRRELYIHTDWPFSRIDGRYPEAIDLINDLIRVALLLASHAPVNQLITGSVIEDVTPRPGILIKLALNPLQVRIGMEAVFQSTSGLIKARVEDIASSQAVARIILAPGNAPNLTANTAMRLQEALN
jgi:hypothetical protein